MIRNTCKTPIARKWFVIILIFVLFCCTSCRDSRSNMIDGRPADHMAYSESSPDGKHMLTVYKNDGRGATVAESLVIIISAMDGGRKWKDKDGWSLFFSYRDTSISATWVDDETVRIFSTEDNNKKHFTLNMSIYQNEF